MAGRHDVRVRSTHIEGFVSGLPDEIPYRGPKQTRTLEDALGAFLAAPAEKAESKRRKSYNVPGTPASKARDNRIMGERDDQA